MSSGGFDPEKRDLGSKDSESQDEDNSTLFMH